MRERGIHFNTEMVRAVMEGRKVQTRRIIVPSMRTADAQFELHQQHDGSWRPMHTFNEGSFDSKGCERPINCPFGAVGDRLWVRETWQVIHDYLDEHDNVDERRYARSIPKQRSNYWHPVYSEAWGDENQEYRGFPWRPSIHMPRWASRIMLEITGVRVERLQGISEADAKAEGLAEITKDGSLFKFGIPDRDGYPGTDDQGWPWTEWERNPVDAYRKLWESIYGEESWQANPWVWVIEFRKVEVTHG